MKPKYDPSKSEAYKALQEESYGHDVQEISHPARAGVFAPQKLQNRVKKKKIKNRKIKIKNRKKKNILINFCLFKF